MTGDALLPMVGPLGPSVLGLVEVQLFAATPPKPDLPLSANVSHS